MQGVLFGLGLLIVEMPTLLILNSWFVKRRGLAYGVLYGIMDLFGVVWGFVANALLHHHGIKITFLVFTAVCFVLPGVGLYFLGERPSSSIEDPSLNTTSLDEKSAAGPDSTPLFSRRRYYHQPAFYLLLLSNLTHSFAFYLPSYTTALGSSPSTGAVVIALANAQVAGEVDFGRLSDKFPVHVLVIVSALISSLSAFLLWSFATSLAYLIPFALLIGAFGSGFVALWPRMGTMCGDRDAGMVYSVMSFGRRAGVIASGPISTALLKRAGG